MADSLARQPPRPAREVIEYIEYCPIVPFCLPLALRKDIEPNTTNCITLYYTKAFI